MRPVGWRAIGWGMLTLVNVGSASIAVEGDDVAGAAWRAATAALCAGLAVMEMDR